MGVNACWARISVGLCQLAAASCLAMSENNGTFTVAREAPATTISILSHATSDEGNRRLQASSCVPGQLYDARARACVACAPGQYQPDAGQNDCIECGAGTFAEPAWTLIPDQTCNSEDLLEVPVGIVYFTAGEAREACARREDCLSAVGYGCDSTGFAHGSWKLCAATSGHNAARFCSFVNHTRVGIGAATCTSCPAGTYQPYGAGGVHKFDASHADDRDDCQICADGSTSLAGSTSPDACGCPPGSYGVPGGCTHCAPGYYQREPGQISCIECAAGTYSLGSTELSLWTQRNDSFCHPASIIYDTFYNPAMGAGGPLGEVGALEACLRDPWCQSVGDDGCDGISPFTCSNPHTRPVSEIQSTVMTCMYFPPSDSSGTGRLIPRQECVRCPAGKYQPYGEGGTNAFEAQHLDEPDDCISCRPGYSQPEIGSTSCNECSAGQYSQGLAATECTSCPSGKYQPYGSGGVHNFDAQHLDSETDCLMGCSVGVAFCTRCSEGYYQVHDGECVACLPGYFASQAGMISCDECSAGKVSTRPASSGCTSCSGGTYQPYGAGGNQSFDAAHMDDPGDCIPCAPGFFSSDEGQSACSECRSGSYAGSGSAICTSCSGGTYQPYGAGGNQSFDAAHMDDPGDCIPCAPGFFSSDEGQSGCSECRSGSYAGSGSVRCTHCPSGQIQPYGAGGIHDFDALHADSIHDCGCNEGESVEISDLKGACVPCPFPERCMGFNCSVTSAGNLCGSCVRGYFTAGRLCIACADSPWMTVIAGASVLVVAAIVGWKISKQEPYTPPSTAAVGKQAAHAGLSVAGQVKQTRNALQDMTAEQTVATQTRASVAGASTTMLKRQTADAVSRSAHTLVASIVWPHFSFSLLPIMVPTMNWPTLITDVGKWLHSIAFLDMAVFANPECFNADADSAQNTLSRLGLSHGGFWIVLIAYALVLCSGKCTSQSKRLSQRAVNATVFAFVLGHALLLRSCLGLLHCVENTSSDINGNNTFSAYAHSTLSAHLQTDPDTACDLRTTWLLVTIMVALTISVFITNVTKPGHRTCLGCIGCSAWVAVCIIAWWIFAFPDENLSIVEYQLPVLGTVGTIVYGAALPALLYRKLKTSFAKGRLDDPDFRARYGYLISRFKPGKWGSEFRIISRKTAILVVTTLLAEQPLLVGPAQILTLGWALTKQCSERPFAEVGSKKAAFEHNTPSGWSRGDVLEALSLGSQIGINVLGLVTVMISPVDASDSVLNASRTNASTTDLWQVAVGTAQDSVAIAATTLVFMVLPLLYGLRISVTECRAGRRQTRESKRQKTELDGTLLTEENPTCSSAVQ